MNLHNFAAKHLILLGGGGVIVGFFIWYFRNRKTYQPVIVCNNYLDWTRRETEFLKYFQRANYIGFDCEWVTKNNKRNPISLLQLATADGLVVLVRLCNIEPGFIPYSLIELLSNKEILKVGVGIYEDSQKLFLDYGLIVESCLDLRYLVQDRPEFQDSNPSLNTLSQVILNADLNKKLFLTCSDWECSILSSQQIIYAAEDALAGAQIFEKLLELSRKRWYFYTSSYIFRTYEQFLNVPFKQSTSLNFKVAPVKKNRQNMVKRPSRIYSKLPLSKMLYENCQLLAPDGEQLCSCDTRKALWYVNKGRGEIVNEKPLIVKLNFEPSGRPILDNTYYIQEKDNCCVVCGATKLLIRKFIVPSEYRKHFPAIMKKNLSHDVLLLCFPCHRKSNMFNDELRKKLEIECDAPIGSEFNAEMKRNSKLVKVKSAAKALLTAGDKIPKERQLELKKLLSDYFEIDEITEKLIKEANNLNCFDTNDNYSIHSQKVYEYMCKNGGLIAFESRWRQHFLKTMKPKFLPKMWSINHNHERLALQVLKNELFLKSQGMDISIFGLSDELLEKVKNLNV